MDMMLMTLKGIKKMLDKAVAIQPSGEAATTGAQLRINVENARDMLEELIKQLEEENKQPPPPPDRQPDENHCACKQPKEQNDGTCGRCKKPIDYKSQVL